MLTTIGIQPAEVSNILSLASGIIPQNNSNFNTQNSLSAENEGLPVAFLRERSRHSDFIYNNHA